MTHRTNKWLAMMLIAGLVAPRSISADVRTDAEKEEYKEAAGGLQCDLGDVLIENLGIGRSYSLRELAGVPMKIRNTGKETVDVVLEVHIPPTDFITDKRKEWGYQAIPDSAWISFTRAEFLIPPGETAFTDVLIQIPDDPKLYGKKFQASIHTRTVGTAFVQLGIWSHLMIAILPNPEAQAELEKNRKRGIRTVAEFTLIPDRIYVEKVPMGRPYDIRKETKKTIKIATSSEEPLELTIVPQSVSHSPLSLQSGFEEGNPGWLKLSNNRFTVTPDALVDPNLVLNIPVDPKLKGRKFMVLLKVDPASSDVVGVTYYGRVLFEVE